jgi:serine/threonine protein kinase
VIRIFAVQILNSLAFLQQERIIHCDIKPENIVMRSWGKSRVKLIDFGSSCFSGQQMFEYLQSRYYRAPEIMLRKPYSYEIDMWSFGCLLIELKIG